MSAGAALDLLAGLVLDTGNRWGESAVAWQWDDAWAVLDPTGPPSHFLTRPRGGSKTTDGGGIGVSLLLTDAPPGSHSYAFASDRDQAGVLLDSIAGFVRATPGLPSAVEVQSWRAINRRTGADLTVMPADGAGTFGLRPWMVFVDEICQWPSTPNHRRVWEAIVSALGKVPGARLLTMSTAGDPAHWSAGILAHALASPRWRVHEVPGPLEWADPAFLAEQAQLLPPSAYARLHLNTWTAPEDRLTTPDDARACVTHAGPLAPDDRHQYVVACDVGVVNDATVAAVCHAEAGEDGTRVVLDRMEVWTPKRLRPVNLGHVEAFLLEASRRYGEAPVVLDPWQALAMAQRLRQRGVTVAEFGFNQASVGRLALTLYRLLRDRLLALPDDEALIEELANVRLRESSPGVWRMEHDRDRHDDRAVALALAAYHLLDEPPVLGMFSAAEIARVFVTSRGGEGGEIPAGRPPAGAKTPSQIFSPLQLQHSAPFPTSAPLRPSTAATAPTRPEEDDRG